MATIQVPPSVRKWTDGTAKVTVSGSTLREVLRDFGTQFPEALTKLLADNNDKPLPFVKIFIDGADSAFSGGMDAEVSARSKISILIAMAGG